MKVKPVKLGKTERMSFSHIDEVISMPNLIEVQKILGHHSILTTVRYTHLTDQTKHHAIDRIDCQQNTRHLASLGATETARSEFLEHLAIDRRKPSPAWRFAAVYWDTLLHQPYRHP